ncbi:flagellar type III secretion system pore protein FliP [Buchnera aphidicola (Kurisakia onigurumii)]|uniref:flagellar type III secretion system pore protein FliP n=1 Tax=Buchnera aphidicola TaxID=9 RepID=UPI0031B689E5
MNYKKFIIFFTSLLLCSNAYSEPMNFFNQFLNKDILNTNSRFPFEILVFVTLLSFIPAFILMMTSFTRIVIVFGLLRNALGTSYAPPNQILIGMALFLTFFIMQPVCNQVYNEAYIPYKEEKINIIQAIQKGSVPFRKFMLKQTKESDLKLFTNLYKIKNFKNKEEIPFQIILPSFMMSEIKSGFQIGFIIFIPFLIIDLVVSSTLMSLGMMMVPPSTISLPLKIMLFVLADGWSLLIKSLYKSFI